MTHVEAREKLATARNRIDFADVRGQEHIKRALLVAVAGRHNILLVGPHGNGKTMLLRAALGLSDWRPSRMALQSLRIRADDEDPPREFIAETWPCPCGDLSDPRRACKCEAEDITTYWRARRPWVQAAEIHVEVPPVPVAILFDRQPGSSTANLREQLDQMRTVVPPQPWALTRDCQQLLKQATSGLGLPVSAVQTCCRVAATIAGLHAEEAVAPAHLAEAIQYRRLDRST